MFLLRALSHPPFAFLLLEWALRGYFQVSRLFRGRIVIAFLVMTPCTVIKNLARFFMYFEKNNN